MYFEEIGSYMAGIEELMNPETMSEGSIEYWRDSLEEVKECIDVGEEGLFDMLFYVKIMDDFGNNIGIMEYSIEQKKGLFKKGTYLDIPDLSIFNNYKGQSYEKAVLQKLFEVYPQATEIVTRLNEKNKFYNEKSTLLSELGFIEKTKKMFGISFQEFTLKR